MKRILLALLLFVLILLSLQKTLLKQAEEGKKNSSTIVLGATIPLTGAAASYGALIRDGMKLAEKDLRNAGYDVRLVFEDVPSPGEPAVTALRKLTAFDRIDGLAANFFNGNIPAMAPILTHERLPSFHTAIADDLIINSGEYVFSTNSTIAEESVLLADYAANTLRAKTAVVLHVGTTFGEQYASHFTPEFEKRGGKILFQQMSALGNDEHKAELLRVIQAQPDVVLAAHFGTGLGALLKQIRALGIKTPVLSVYEAEDPSVLMVAGEAAEGVVFYEPEPSISAEARKKFISDFEQAYHYPPRVLATNAYDATSLLARTIATCRKEKDCVLKKLRDLKGYSGASGTFSIGPRQTGERTFRLKTVKNGAFVPIENGSPDLG